MQRRARTAVGCRRSRLQPQAARRAESASRPSGSCLPCAAIAVRPRAPPTRVASCHALRRLPLETSPSAGRRPARAGRPFHGTAERCDAVPTRAGTGNLGHALRDPATGSAPSPPRSRLGQPCAERRALGPGRSLSGPHARAMAGQRGTGHSATGQRESPRQRTRPKGQSQPDTYNPGPGQIVPGFLETFGDFGAFGAPSSSPLLKARARRATAWPSAQGKARIGRRSGSRPAAAGEAGRRACQGHLLGPAQVIAYAGGSSRIDIGSMVARGLLGQGR